MDKVWLKQYPKGVPEEIPATKDETLVDLILGSCREFADKPAFTNMGATLTYR